MTQTILNFKIESTNEKLTPRTGIAIFGDLLYILKSNKYKNKPVIAKLLLYFVKFALSTGARDSSIINIKCSNIDLKTQTVQIFDTQN